MFVAVRLRQSSGLRFTATKVIGGRRCIMTGLRLRAADDKFNQGSDLLLAITADQNPDVIVTSRMILLADLIDYLLSVKRR